MLLATAAVVVTAAGQLASAAPAPGASAFVVESSVVVRAAPDDAAAMVREIGIWTAVKVDGVKDGWAHVVVGPRTLRYDSPGGEARPLAPSSFDARAPSGFVHAAALDTEPTSRLGLVAAAKSAKDGRIFLARALALDPNDPDVAHAFTAAAIAPVSRREHSPFSKVDLVFGCRGDTALATVTAGGLLGRDPPEADVCLAHVDLRASCGADGGGRKAAAARFVARFGKDGPALRLLAGLGASARPVYVVTRLLAADGCSSDCNPLVASTDVKVERLRVPVVDGGRTVLHVLVPRYTGAVYDIVAADSAEDVDADRETFELGADFDVDPRDDAPAGEHLFVAPEACCACDDEP